jgi:hypothetical protein
MSVISPVFLPHGSYSIEIFDTAVSIPLLYMWAISRKQIGKSLS